MIRLIIDGIPATEKETKDLVQEYTDLEGGRSHRRTADGTSHGQEFFYKRKTTLRGEAWERPSFYSLKIFSAYMLQSVGYVEAASSTPVIALPSDVRPDSTVIGSAQVDGEWIPAIFKQVAQDLIFEAVELAGAYRIEYAPQFMARLTGKKITEKTNALGWDWFLEFEEI